VGKKKGMKPAPLNLAAEAPCGWLQGQTEDFWVRLQVYPDAIRHTETSEEYEHKARSILQKSGTGNLRYLCKSAGVRFRASGDSSDQLATHLFQSDSRTELIYLATFLRSRVTAVVEFFDEIATSADRAALEAEVASESTHRPETPKPFTKLVWMFRSNPMLLEAIQFRHAWRRLPTVFTYTVPTGLSAKAVTELSSNIQALIVVLDKLKSGESYASFGQKNLIGRITVFVLHRCFPPSVKSDYQNSYRLQHDFSIVTFAVDAATSTFLIKVANRSVSDAIRQWINDTLKVTLHDAGASLFSNYKPESVEDAFLGGYDELLGIDVVGITFRYSFGPNHSPLTLKSNSFSRSVREDLSWLKQSHVVRLRSLAEIEQLILRFEGHEVEVTGEVEKGGSIRFHLSDKNLTEETAASLRTAFREAFHVPLDQSIDPTMLTMGPSEIYHFLLSGVSEEQVLPYQKAWLAVLIEKGLLKTVEGKMAKCTNLNCSSHSQLLSDTSLLECGTCQGPLKWEEYRRYEEDKKMQVRIVREFLQKATGWKLDPTLRSFESHKFHRLTSPKNPSQTVGFFINDRLSPGKVETFHRAMFPLIVIHPLGQQILPVIDIGGIAHIGLPSLIAARDTDDDWKKLRSGCADVLKRLLRMEKERVMRTSRASYDTIRSRAAGYDDRNYEADVYNLLRSLFSFTVKWGGGNKPDGFSSLVFFPNNDLRNSTKFNWSYDAKYTETTYPFGIGEFRQMFDYVRRLHAPKRLKSLGNSYDAHVFITNAMEESAMQNAANFMATQHRLGTETPDFLLVFMRDAFLIKLWELVRESESEFDKRGTYLAEFFVSMIRNRMSDGYCLLDAAAAVALVDDVLAENVIQDPVDGEKLTNDLKKQSKPTGASPTRRRPKAG
jgi:hypothetical protein